MTENAHFPKQMAIGSDHVGFELKKYIKKHLEGLGIECLDVGASSSERTDYPLYARQAARLVTSGEAELGILICGTGVGMSIAANKVAGIRAVVCSEPYSAALARQHNDANVLCFGAQVVASGLARMIVDAFLEAVYEGGRHTCRLDMIKEIEAGAQGRQGESK
jgi:ribose 5-phosphate isomerase B